MTNDTPIAPRVPRATYRLQLRREFPFEAAERVVPYLAALGISHLYLSPILASRKGSVHGYDGVDFTHVDPEIGGEEGLASLVAAARRHGMGIIADIVPNHMAVGGADNRFWLDVLENGPSSRYAHFFDIDWKTPDPVLEGKVAAPFLGAPYGEALAGGEITLVFDPHMRRLCAAYYHHRFPLNPGDYGEILRGGDASLHALADRFDEARTPEAYKEARIELAREAGETLAAALEAASKPDVLHPLLERQNWRLAWWRTAGDEINWRRFFDITELAGLRVEDEEVFEAVHAEIFRLYEAGLIDGLRIDHVDGLADPAGYGRRLRERLDEIAARRPPEATPGPAIVWVEKILAHDESLAGDWAVDGTTGYEFMDAVSGLLHSPEGEEMFTDLWSEISGRYPDFASEELDARNEMLVRSFAGQLDAVAHAFHDLARLDLETRDVTYHAIRRALVALVAAFPAYRTYATAGAAPGADAPILERAVEAAKDMAAPGEAGIVDLLAGWISGIGVPDQEVRARAVTALQQLCAPVAAKSVEDTAFYRYGRLVSRCEVGSDPGRFAIAREAFHAQAMERAERFPHGLLATATHDHKRGEDLRARLAALSELPAEWADRVGTWLDLNKRHTRDAIDPADEYVFYQMLLGAWPFGLAPDDAEGVARLGARLVRWQEKALREAKLNSSWTEPDEAYETACRTFVEAATDVSKSSAFLASIHAFAEALAPAGAANGLVQSALRSTAPGVPDCYQGREFWDFSLVDPDNRDPVDYEAREAALADAAPIADLAASYRDGRVKQRVIARCLEARRALPELFAQGEYLPLAVRGPRAAHVVAFARRHSSSAAIVVTGRLLAAPLVGGDALVPRAEWWGETRIVLPNDLVDAEMSDALEGGRRGFGTEVPVAELLPTVPVGLWTMG
ncbi:malto-oligosyltrehalose synthase [Salinarimonas ramus]|uniref:Malto-oligosyltrehalose synthase n=1 Tax=Salinarimonas ramus TaxID=690164 RepID=A0A917Q6U9_9HYPH|nr:malto-oligosyltrehalose synthase [Salinarimonas ramus]GGK31270.1 malto-oligosyltrehalose synthase [Salinarimonas ramus]